MGGTQRLLGLVEGLHGQAPAGEHTAEAGLPRAARLSLDLHPYLDVGPLPVVKATRARDKKERPTHNTQAFFFFSRNSLVNKLMYTYEVT